MLSHRHCEIINTNRLFFYACLPKRNCIHLITMIGQAEESGKISHQPWVAVSLKDGGSALGGRD